MMNATPYILLVGNYRPDRQESMLRYAAMLETECRRAGLEAELIQPQPVLGHLASPRGPGRWLGYADKFLLFPFRLRSRINELAAQRKRVLVHVCDHSNAPYLRAIPDLAERIITCHDLLAVRAALGEFPQQRTGFTGRLLQRYILRGLKTAPAVFCDSSPTLEDVVRLAGVPRERCRVVHLAFNRPLERVPATDLPRRLQDLGLGSPGKPIAPYLLHIGSSAWYKNREGLLRLYAALVERRADVPRLVLAGEPLPQAVRAWMKDRGLSGDRVIELGPVPDGALNALYSGAELFVFPSHMEGFGWPILEAMACGCRVLATRTPPLTEIGGTAAFYMDRAPAGASEADCNAWALGAADAVSTLLDQSPRERADAIAAGLAHAATFTAERMVGAYRAGYAELPLFPQS